MNRLLGVVALLSGLLASGAFATDSAPARGSISLESLMQQLQQSGGVRSDFVERRAIAILVEPIESRGTLYFDPPDRIARVTTHPGHSTAVVSGKRADVEDETGRRSVDLRSSDVAYSLISNIMVLLRGDLPALRERYDVQFASEGSAWQLDLEPRSATLRGLIVRVRVKGVGGRVTEMETLESNGDATHASFSNVETGVDFGDDANSRVFRFDSDPAPDE